MSEDGKKVVYRRINGRIVPIKVSVKAPAKKLTGAELSDALSDSLVLGSGVFGAAKAAQIKFKAAANKITNMLTKYKLAKPAMPIDVLPSLTKTGKVRKRVLGPDMFAMADYRGKTTVFKSRTARLARLSNKAGVLRGKAKLLGRYGLPAALLAAGASATLSLYPGAGDD